MELVLNILDTLATGLGWGLIIGGALVFAAYYLRPDGESSKEVVAPKPEPASVNRDAFKGFTKARERQPLPRAKSDLEAAEIAGPVFVHQPERVVRERRR